MRLGKGKATLLSTFAQAIILASIYFLDCQSSQSSNVMGLGPNVPQIDGHVVVNEFPSYDRVTNGMSAKEVFKILGPATGGCDLHFISGANDKEECRTSFHWNLCVKKDMNVCFLHAFITFVQYNSTNSSWKSILNTEAEGWIVDHINIDAKTMTMAGINEKAKRDQQRYEERYNDYPPEVRSILRARTLRNDPNLCAYRAELNNARNHLNPALVRQLIRLMNYGCKENIAARWILEALYMKSREMDSDPPYMLSKETKNEALQVLIDALVDAKDRMALEDGLLVFLRASGINKINLDIPEAGVIIDLECHPNQGDTSNSGNIRGNRNVPRDSKWKSEIKIIANACQEWCRMQLEER